MYNSLLFARSSVTEVTMTDISVSAQQIIIDALGAKKQHWNKTVLCHTQANFSSNAGLFLSTHDRLQELFCSCPDSVISVFHNTPFVKRLCKQFREEKFSVELVYACHSSSDPQDLILDLLSKFPVDFKFIKQVSYLVDLPERTL